MSYYSEEEKNKLNKQLLHWQVLQLAALQGNNPDIVFETMSEMDRAVWEKVANAKTYTDINYLVWNNAERIINKYCKIAK